MKKQIISTVAAVALAASLAMPAAAVWQPSRVQQSGTGTAASTPSGTTSTELEVVNEVPTGTDGKAINVETSQNPWIKVTAVADALAANEKFSADLSFSQKEGELTETGLFYSTNADTNLIYAAMDKAESTEAFLKLFGEDALAKVQVGGTGSNVGTGGMVTKMEAARVAAVSGIPAVLTCASNAGPAMMGDPVGTAFAPINDRGSSRRLWIGFASHPQGALVADSGAAKAVRGGAASLLAAGVVEVKGDFAAGDAVWVDDEQGNHLAKGLVGFDSEEIPQMLGRNTAQLKRFLGEEYAHPLVHRDNLVLV